MVLNFKNTDLQTVVIRPLGGLCHLGGHDLRLHDRGLEGFGALGVGRNLLPGTTQRTRGTSSRFRKAQGEEIHGTNRTTNTQNL